MMPVALARVWARLVVHDNGEWQRQMIESLPPPC